jgi:hypothetical protein
LPPPSANFFVGPLDTNYEGSRDAIPQKFPAALKLFICVDKRTGWRDERWMNEDLAPAAV